MEGKILNPFIEKVEYAITNRQILNIKTYKYLTMERDFIDGVITRYLDSLGLLWLDNRLSYCIHELAVNAHKANTKRVFFDHNRLNLYSSEDYESGMDSFREETFEHLDHYLDLQRKAGLHVFFHFRLKKETLHIKIRNNTPTTREERRRIREKLAIASQYENLADAYDSSEDYSEGAGLGIVMLSLMLNTMGAGKGALTFTFGAQETVANIELDLSRMTGHAPEASSELYA